MTKPDKDTNTKKNKFIPDTKIKVIQLKPINNVWPKSGCIINNNEMRNVKEKEKINFIVKLGIFLFEIIKAKITIKKGLTNSIGWILGKKIKSNHLFDPLISTPKIWTKMSKTKDTKKI